jgi:hypothetical protein
MVLSGCSSSFCGGSRQFPMRIMVCLSVFWSPVTCVRAAEVAVGSF